jgi:hypothetical protein
MQRGTLPRVFLASLFFACLVFLGVAHAHTASESFSRWSYTGNTLSMQFTVNAREVSRIPATDKEDTPQQRLANYLVQQVTAGGGESACTPSAEPKALASRPAYVQVEMVWHCASPPRSLGIHAFFDLAAEHVHFASMDSPRLTAGDMEQKLLTRERPNWTPTVFNRGPSAASGSPGGFLDYVKLGFRHIAGGPDHVVFLLGLLLLCQRFRDVIWAVTGFTLGHSITLSLAALGLVQANVAAIEATIGLTIALVAVERTANVQRSALPLALLASGLILLLLPIGAFQHGSMGAIALIGLALFSFCYLMGSKQLAGRGIYRMVITALFGLVHGFGFAGAFQAASMGQSSLLLPLAGFNIGVELGQLALVAAMVGLGLTLARYYRAFAAAAADWVAAIVCGFGVFWFVQRSFVLT